MYIFIKHIFARWQAILSVFYFDIKYIKGSQNAIPDFHLVNLTAQNEVYTHYYANHIPEKTFTLEDDFILENEAFRSHPVNNSNITNDLYLIAEAQIVEWYHTHHYFQAILSLYNCASASNAVSLPPFMVSEPLFSGR